MASAKEDPSVGLDLLLAGQDGGPCAPLRSKLQGSTGEGEGREFVISLERVILLNTVNCIGQDLYSCKEVVQREDGRFQSSPPPSPADQAASQTGNNFDSSAKPERSFHAFRFHLCTTNLGGLRDDQMSAADKPGCRIVCRAVSLDTHQLGDEPKHDPEPLFSCCQASIENQFDFLQSRWVHAIPFVPVGARPDPLIGQPPGRQIWPPCWGAMDTKTESFPLAVLTKVGDDLFAPSFSFLRPLTPP